MMINLKNRCFLLLLSIIPLAQSSKLIDLTYAVDESTIYWPSGSPFNFTEKFAGVTDQGFFYSANEFQTPEHLGTHVDAPYHFCQECLTLDQLPIENFILNGFVVDISRKCEQNADYLLSVDDLKFTNEDLALLQGQKNILLVRTGWGRHWLDKGKYLGTNDNDVSKLRFPGIGEDAAKYIVSSKLFVSIGIDTASTDYGQSKEFKTHQVLAHASMYSIENVANLDQLPLSGFTIYAFPMKIKGGTGGPVRLLARLSEKYRKVEDITAL